MLYYLRISHHGTWSETRLRQLGCPIARGNHFLVWATMIYRRTAQPGKFKLEVSLYQSYHTNIKNHVLLNYKPSKYSDLIYLVIWTHLGKQFYGQACPTGQPKKIVAAYQRPIWTNILAANEDALWECTNVLLINRWGHSQSLVY